PSFGGVLLIPFPPSSFSSLVFACDHLIKQSQSALSNSVKKREMKSKRDYRGKDESLLDPVPSSLPPPLSIPFSILSLLTHVKWQLTIPPRGLAGTPQYVSGFQYVATNTQPTIQRVFDVNNGNVGNVNGFNNGFNNGVNNGFSSV
ncbi:hypothetical protein PRIPAC_96183, partial [Pristionchus pacificus]